MKGITFGNYHSYDDFNLLLVSKEVGSPSVKVKEIDIPGADGSLDLTDFFGEAKYENLTHKFQFQTIVPQSNFLSLFSHIKNKIHGKKLRIILDDDPLFYYVGRCFVSAFTNEKNIGTVAVECVCEPWKYKLELTRQKVLLYSKNVFDKSNVEQGTLNAVVGETFEKLKGQNGSRLRSKNLFYVKPNTKYTLTIPDGFQATLRQFDSAGRMLSADGWRTGNYTFLTSVSTDSLALLFAFIQTKTILPSDIIDAGFQLEEGENATEYEPFATEESRSVQMLNLKRISIPKIYASGQMIIRFEGNSVAVNYSTITTDSITFHEGNNEVTITGGGAVVFVYQEGGL